MTTWMILAGLLFCAGLLWPSEPRLVPVTDEEPPLDAVQDLRDRVVRLCILATDAEQACKAATQHKEAFEHQCKDLKEEREFLLRRLAIYEPAEGGEGQSDASRSYRPR